MIPTTPTVPPGPWCWRRCSAGWGLFTERGGAIVVMETLRPEEGTPTVYLAVRGESGFMVQVYPEHPVARLLAAAPDLLAACEKTLAVIELHEKARAEPGVHVRGPLELIADRSVAEKMLRDAVARAKGVQP